MKKGNILIPLLAGALVVSLALVGFLFWQTQTHLFSTKEPVNVGEKNTNNPKDKFNSFPSGTETNLQGRIIYEKEEELFSILPDGTDIINLTAKGIKNDNDYGHSLLSPDRTKIFYVIGGTIYQANTNGTNIKKIVENKSFDPPFQINLINSSSDGKQLLFAYEEFPGMFVEPKNPNITYGLYYIDLNSKKGPKYLGPEFGAGISHDFAGFVGTKPIYTTYDSADIYKLNLDGTTSTYIALSQRPDTTIKIIDSSTNSVIYYTRTSSPDNSLGTSQLFEETIGGKPKPLTPQGNYAEYQSLAVSPNFQKIIYGHHVPIGDGIYRTEYFLYNRKSGETKLLPIDTIGVLTWADNDSILYEEVHTKDGIIYEATTPILWKYNISTGQKEKIADNARLYNMSMNINR